MTKEMLEKKAVNLLDTCKIVTVSSVDAQGYPRPCAVVKIKNEGFDTIWFATGANSRKTAHFKQNPKAGLSYYIEADSVTLTGKVEIIVDVNIKKGLWSDWMVNHFPGGANDPNFCLIKFTAAEATFFIDHAFETYRYDLQA